MLRSGHQASPTVRPGRCGCNLLLRRVLGCETQLWDITPVRLNIAYYLETGPTIEGSGTKRTDRRVSGLTVPVMVSAGLISGTAIALADSTDDTFIAKMHNLGFTWPAGDDSDIVSMRHQIWADRTAGKTPDTIASDIHSTLGPKGISFADVTSVVSAAESTYCAG